MTVYRYSKENAPVSPGPWKFNNDYLLDAQGSLVTILAQAPTDADRRLIEAAPELLEVIRSVASTPQHTYPNNALCKCSQCYLTREAGAIVNKILGKSV